MAICIQSDQRVGTVIQKLMSMKHSVPCRADTYEWNNKNKKNSLDNQSSFSLPIYTFASYIPKVR